jgi:hypothetical protein
MSTLTQGIELFNIFSETWGKEKAQLAIKDIEEIIDSRKQDLATKSDMQKIDIKLSEIELKIEQVRSSTIKWVVGWMVTLVIAQTGAISAIFMLLK